MHYQWGVAHQWRALSIGGGTKVGGGTFHGGWWHIPGGFDFGPYLVDGRQGGIHRGLIARETTGAPILLRAFFKGSEVKRERKGNLTLV